jgi:hypothetical protein
MTRLAILTTETLHHAHFVRELAKTYPDLLCVLEKTSIKAPFDTAHPFEQQREIYETDYFFDGQRRATSDFANTIGFDVINQPESVAALKEFNPDVVITFGARKIGKDMIAACQNRIINLHGGDPEEYRGLDSHLWAIYHGDYDGLVTSLHVLNETLDDGHIIGKQKLDVGHIGDISQLRSINTEACVSLCMDALSQYERDGKITSVPQSRIGRYYSFMPAVMKQLCVDKFNKFKAQHGS